MSDATPFLPGLSPLGRRPLTAERDAGNLTSNGSLIALRESALRLGVAGVLAEAKRARPPSLYLHTADVIGDKRATPMAFVRRSALV